jgi:aspartyl-tRNA(Asn)/glutamyl-tRNA(Gln) amidotransferase subunit A
VDRGQSQSIDSCPIHYQTIVEIAASIRRREITSSQLVEHFLARIDLMNGKLNAYKLVCPEMALQNALAADKTLRDKQDSGPLCGIPYAAKDLFDVRGLPTTAGSKLLEGNTASKNAEAIRRLNEEDMVLLGKTNTVQFAFSGVGINHDHGTPHNPWRQSHYLPGGSSSGSAVAVAAGLVPMALGTDTGGSVRVPASLCGIVGLKTTVGRISRAGVYPLSWTLDSVGVFSRTVEDAALVYQYLQGADSDDDKTLGLSSQNVLKELNGGVHGLRLTFAESMFWEDVHPAVAQAVRECAHVFESLGAEVSSIEFPEAEEARQLNPGGLVIAPEGYTVNKNWLEEHFDELDPVVAHRMIKGRDVTAARYLQNIYATKRLRAKAYARLKNLDAVLVPTTPLPAQPVTAVDIDMTTYLKQNALYLRNTSAGNILNLCGLSIPCGLTDDGLPIGLMIYGKPFHEDDILRIGYAFQQTTEWHRRVPDLSWIKKI